MSFRSDFEQIFDLPFGPFKWLFIVACVASALYVVFA